MIRLRRAARVREKLALPDGRVLRVDFDAETNARAFVAAQNAVISAAIDAEHENTEAARRAFYAAYRALLALLLGEDGLKAALAAYDGDLPELCGQLDPWIAHDVAPAARAASREAMEQRRDKFLREQKAARRRGR